MYQYAIIIIQNATAVPLPVCAAVLAQRGVVVAWPAPGGVGRMSGGRVRGAGRGGQAQGGAGSVPLAAGRVPCLRSSHLGLEEALACDLATWGWKMPLPEILPL